MRANIHLNPQMSFYPKDFLTHTAFLTDSQAIRYLKILCNMYIHGRLTEKQMIFIYGGYDKEVFEMFCIDEEGKYYDEKLEYEIMKRDEYQNKSTARKRGRAKAVKPTGGESKPKAEKRPYGSKKNVFLTDEEYRLLKEKFGEEADNKIEALCLYMLSKGEKYKEHFATIMSWELNNEMRKNKDKLEEKDYSEFEEMAVKYN